MGVTKRTTPARCARYSAVLVAAVAIATTGCSTSSGQAAYASQVNSRLKHSGLLDTPDPTWTRISYLFSAVEPATGPEQNAGHANVVWQAREHSVDALTDAMTHYRHQGVTFTTVACTTRGLLNTEGTGGGPPRGRRALSTHSAQQAGSQMSS